MYQNRNISFSLFCHWRLVSLWIIFFCTKNRLEGSALWEKVILICSFPFSSSFLRYIIVDDLRIIFVAPGLRKFGDIEILFFSRHFED